ncbi:fibrous sheath-interacting protein 1 isoform X2 [Acanthochromis polyacanthus]|uniref:fibrous sheath-interacting protein 1 isoform X2 n=1 Tax=Acanthochromis polyacanthus TaxID=80966 RepID=UPI0022342DC9|nr:fibrous sheath-interacting protein 1 isoform X2 [Acanthochromis polyacanthus]
MEIIRGSLDNISRPASSEQTGSRVSSVSLPHRDRICPAAPFSLVVLSSDAADIQIHSSSKETAASNPNSSVRDPGNDKCHTVTTEEEDENSKLQRAIEEMRRLDEILSAKICREKEIQRQRKELQAKLWQELLNKPEGHSECAHEALNTKLFLALEAPAGTEEEDNFVPVFETQVSECEDHRDNQHLEQSEKKPDSLTDSLEVGYKDKAEGQFECSHCGVSKGMNKQKDFVKRNIELVNGEGGQVFLTQAEKARLAELLQEIDEEDGARGADSEGTMWAVSVLTDEGYTPEPSDLEQLIDIDSKIHHLHPDKDFHSYTSSYTNLSMSQDRLPDLTEEQLLSLLDECELTERCSQDLQTNDAAP